MRIASKRKAELLAGPYTNLLIQHEEALAEIYSVFASALTHDEEFWARMSKEELDHKRIIEAIEEKFQGGEWRFARPGFVASAIMDSCDQIAAKKESVEQNGISMKEAILYAIDLEHSLIEMDFFKILDNDGAHMMNTLESLTSYTRAHVRHLELEAKRMKWRPGSRKRHKVKVNSSAASTDKLKESIKSSQADIIGSLVALEEAISNLYTVYSQRIKGHEKYWSRFAAEEMQHAAMLRKLYDVLERGNVFYNVALFKPNEIMDQIDKLLNMAFDAKYSALSLYSAVNSALEIENTLAEGSFYSTVESDAPEYKYIAERMIRFSKEHVSALEEEAGKAIDMGILATRPEKTL